MAFQLVSLRDRHLSRDWTQQELAEFYRVESVLGAAGIAVEMDRGLSDEGDPWFVFCRPQNGDVVIHFARYDGMYLAASGALGQVLRGRNFRELVDAFIARQPLVMPGQNQTGNSVVLHPSTLLTALVATALYLLDHQTADAAPVLIDVNIDGETAQTHQPDNKFAALINLLIEPLRPHEQREALLAIGAIVAGIAAISFDAAKDTPVLAPAVELTSAEIAADQQQSDEDRLAQNAQAATRKMADADAGSNIQIVQDDGAGATPQKLVIAELIMEQVQGRFDVTLAPRSAPSETAHKDTATITIDGDSGALPLPFFRSAQGHDNDTGRKDIAADGKLATPQAPASGATVAEQVATVHIPADKAEILLQDSIAASLTKTFGAGTFIHLSFVEASSLPQMTSEQLSKLVNNATVETPKLSTAPFDSQQTSLAFSAASAPSGIDTQVSKVSAIEEKAMEAISFFAKSNPDFKITQLGKDIILFDFEARPDNKIVYDVHSWALPDGSKITIIGALPEQLEA